MDQYDGLMDVLENIGKSLAALKKITRDNTESIKILSIITELTDKRVLELEQSETK